MVHLHVVDDHVVDPARIDDAADVVEEFAAKRLFDRVEKGHLFIQNEIGIVGGSLVGRVSVEVPNVPIDGSHPIDVFLDLDRWHRALISFRLKT